MFWWAATAPTAVLKCSSVRPALGEGNCAGRSLQPGRLHEVGGRWIMVSPFNLARPRCLVMIADMEEVLVKEQQKMDKHLH